MPAATSSTVESTGVVEAVDDRFRGRAHGGLEVDLVQLATQVIGQALADIGGVLHRLELAVAGLFGRAATHATRTVAAATDEVVQPLEHVLGVVHQAVVVLVVVARRRLGRAEQLVYAIGRGLEDLERFVLLQLVLDELLQVQGGQLQDLDALDDLRREPHFLLQLEVEPELESHCRVGPLGASLVYPSRGPSGNRAAHVTRACHGEQVGRRVRAGAHVVRHRTRPVVLTRLRRRAGVDRAGHR